MNENYAPSWLVIASMFFGICLVILAGGAHPLLGSTHFSVKASASDSNLGLSSQQSVSGSLSVGFDLLSFLQIGVTHRQAFTQTQGFKLIEELDAYVFQEEYMKNVSNSLDLTLILYNGQIFTPYIQGGMVNKDYWITSKLGGVLMDSRHVPIGFVPNGGAGVGIVLTQNFSLNVSYNLSPGIIQKTPMEAPESVLDSYLSAGFGYKL